jgi:malonate decarboxylase epsilon subunit
MSLAFLFPGQGAQRPGMLHTLPGSPAAAHVLDDAHAEMRRLGLATDIDSATALKSTTNAQLALLIAGVACARALKEDYALAPEFVAGHSVGAFAAAVTAGVITLEDAVSAVALRGRLMEEACADGDWGMAAATGLPTRTVAQVAARVCTESDPIWLANVNSATQTVFSGTETALQNLALAAKHAGAFNFERLDVSVASHCPLQAGTARRLADHMAGLPRRTPTARYLTNTRGRATTSADVVIDDLAQAVAHPVQWYDATRLMTELGATCTIETLPGHVLTRLMSSAAPTVVPIALQDNGFEAAAHRARHHQDVEAANPDV